MTQRFDALCTRAYTDRDGNAKTQWVNIGTAFTGNDGSIRVLLNAAPLPSLDRNGQIETVIHLREPRARDDAPRNGTPARNNRAPVDDDLDEIPFLTMGEPLRRSIFP